MTSPSRNQAPPPPIGLMTRNPVVSTEDGTEGEDFRELLSEGPSQSYARAATLLQLAQLFSRTVEKGEPPALFAHKIIEEGIPSRSVWSLLHRLVFLKATSPSLMKALGISQRTLQRRRETPAKKLTPDQSGRAWKFAEVLSKATQVFGSQERAEQWLNSPALGLDRKRPIDLLTTSAGAELVETHLTRLEYGVYT